MAAQMSAWCCRRGRGDGHAGRLRSGLAFGLACVCLLAVAALRFSAPTGGQPAVIQLPTDSATAPPALVAPAHTGDEVWLATPPGSPARKVEVNQWMARPHNKSTASSHVICMPTGPGGVCTCLLRNVCVDAREPVVLQVASPPPTSCRVAARPVPIGAEASISRGLRLEYRPEASVSAGSAAAQPLSGLWVWIDRCAACACKAWCVCVCAGVE